MIGGIALKCAYNGVFLVPDGEKPQLSKSTCTAACKAGRITREGNKR